MKLIISIIHSDDAPLLIDALSQEGFGATIISTTGGFLREGNAAVLSGIPDDRVERALTLIDESCHVRMQQIHPVPALIQPDESTAGEPVEVKTGGAIVFVLNIERFERY